MIPGKPYMISAKNQTKKHSKPPSEFDSLVFYNENEQNNGLFKHDYILFDSA